MPELREVFEMTTKQIEPDVDAWRELEERQRRTTRNRKIGALAVAAAIGVTAAVLLIRVATSEDRTQPLVPPVEQPVPEVDYTIDLNTGEMTPLPTAIVGVEGIAGYAVSPDMTRVAFAGQDDAGTTQIFVADLDGSEIEQVTHAAEASMPAWSPDGARIAFAGREDAGGPVSVYVLDLATGASNPVTTETGEVFSPQFTPDGSSIVYSTHRDDGDHVRIVPVTGGKSVRLAGGRGADAGDGRLSPDGSLLSYGCSEVVGGQANRCVSNADGSDPRVVLEGNFPTASWSPDGARLAYWSFPELGVYVLDVATGDTTEVAAGAWPRWLDDHTLIVEFDSGL